MPCFSGTYYNWADFVVKYDTDGYKFDAQERPLGAKRLSTAPIVVDHPLIARRTWCRSAASDAFSASNSEIEVNTWL